MPTYTYLCDDGHETDVEHSITQEPLTTCPVEGCAQDCRRLVGSSTSFVLTGTGWTR